MAIDVERTRSYRLMYFQPDPEDGERVCVAILFRDRHVFVLAYDPSFRKLSCLAPQRDRGMLRLYLDELADSLQNANPNDAQIILKKAEPQIVASGERTLLAPLTNDIKQRLLDRFVLPSYSPERVHIKEQVMSKQQDETDESISGFIKHFVATESANVIFRAKSRQIIGRTLPNVAPVAASIRVPGKVVLIDGVNLRVASAKQVINRVNRIAHTFWEYGRAEREQLVSGNDSIQRVALVLNGLNNYSIAQKDAHDFALHQFRKEADLVITDPDEQHSKFRSLLETK